MSEYILDTDHFSLWQQEHPLIVELVKTNAEKVSTTVVTAEELLRGRFHTIRQASQSSKADMLVLAYEKLWETLDDLKILDIVKFDDRAYNRYLELRRQKIRIGTQDLRIAAIVLSHNGILVTRNRRDFAQVPGLVFEDWTAE